MGHTRCAVQPPSLATNSRFCAKHEVSRKARGAKIERLFVENMKKEQIIPISFRHLSFLWLEEGSPILHSLSCLPPLSTREIYCRLRLSFLLAAWETSHKRTTKKRLFLCSRIFFLCRKGNRRSPPPTGKPQQEDFSPPCLLP